MKFLANSPELVSYCLAVSSPLHPFLEKLMQETRLIFPAASHKMSSPQVLALNQFIIRATRSTQVLDIGVFTGASTLAAALAVPEHGRVVGLEKSRKYANMARSFCEEAGVGHRVDIQIGDAKQLLEAVQGEATNSFDFAYIDAEKTGYVDYFRLCMPLIRPGGILAVDNTLFRGKVLEDGSEDRTTGAVLAANAAFRSSEDVTALCLNISDGYTLLLKH